YGTMVNSARVPGTEPKTCMNDNSSSPGEDVCTRRYWTHCDPSAASPPPTADNAISHETGCPVRASRSQATTPMTAAAATSTTKYHWSSVHEGRIIATSTSDAAASESERNSTMWATARVPPPTIEPSSECRSSPGTASTVTVTGTICQSRCAR